MIAKSVLRTVASVVVVVCVVIAFITLHGPQRRAAANLVASEVPTSTVTQALPPGGQPAVQAPGQGKVEVAYSFTLLAHQLAATPGAVDVHTAIGFMDTDDTSGYVWILKVFSRDLKTMFVRKVYDHQLFSRRDVANDVVTFDEHLPLQPGRYQVGVSLCKIPANFDLATLKLPAVEKRRALVGGMAEVTVP